MKLAELLALDVEEAVDILRPMLLAPKSTATPTPTDGPMLMRRRDYAKRAARSARTLDSELPADCFCGSGKLRRVIIAKADAFLLAESNVDEDQDEITRIARARARGRAA